MTQLLTAVFASALALTVGAARSAAEPPEAESAEAASFKISQEYQVEGLAKVIAQFHFSGDHAVMTDEDGEPVALYNLSAMTFYSDRHEKMIDQEFMQAWLTGWRVGAAARKMLADPNNAPFVRSLLWPKLVVSDEDDKLLIRTKAMHFEVVPMKDTDAASATAYAKMYKLEAQRNALETRSVPATFIAAAVADVLGERKVIPASIKVTTFTPKGSAVATGTLRRDEMSEDETERVRTVAERIDPPQPAPNSDAQ